MSSRKVIEYLPANNSFQFTSVLAQQKYISNGTGVVAAIQLIPGLLFLEGGARVHCSPAANISFKVAISCWLCYSKLADTQNLCMNLPQSNLITEPPLVDQNTLTYQEFMWINHYPNYADCQTTKLIDQSTNDKNATFNSRARLVWLICLIFYVNLQKHVVNMWKISGIMRPCRPVKAQEDQRRLCLQGSEGWVRKNNNRNNRVKPDPDLATLIGKHNNIND